MEIPELGALLNRWDLIANGTKLVTNPPAGERHAPQRWPSNNLDPSRAQKIPTLEKIK